MNRTSLKILNLKAKCALSVLSVVLLITAGVLSGQSRKLDLGDKMLEFTATDVSEAQVSYEYGKGLVNIVAFLSSDQKQSIQAAGDLKKIFSKLESHKKQVHLYVITDSLKTYSHFHSAEDSSPFVFSCLIDKEHEFWGKFGVIATPTIFISDKSDKIVWMKAGYGYDFAPSVEAHIKVVLGITEEQQEDLTTVQTVTNTTDQAKVKRHLRMAKTLEGKKRFDSAIREVLNALQLDPNSVEATLALGELYCRTGNSKKALELVRKVKVERPQEKAKLNLVLGWANSQMDKLDEAEKHLLEASKLNPNSPRVFFELGKVYQAKGDKDKAIEAYHKALSKIFGQ